MRLKLLKHPFFLCLAAASGLASVSIAAAEKMEIRGNVLDIAGGGITVDIGALQNLKPGLTGVLKRGGLRLGSVEVLRMDRDTSFLRVFNTQAGFSPRADDAAFFTVDRPPAPAAAGAGLGGEETVPLLAPLPLVKKKRTPGHRISSRTHGSVRFWQFYQRVAPNGFDQRISRLDSDGASDRIGGGRWSLVWSGNAGYQDGRRPVFSDDFRRVRLHARRLYFSRPVSDAGIFRAGRFFPNELPELGTVDGLALRAPLSSLKIGVIAGARPDRNFQEFSSHELLGSLYASMDSGKPGEGSYSAALGMFRTSWLGRLDELAALFDQTFDIGPRLAVYETAQFNFNGGAATLHKKTRLTRFDLSANSRLNTWLLLRGGVNHYEPVDTAAERAVTGGNSVAVIDNGYWRYWTGGGQALPWNLGMDEEISWTRTAGVPAQGLWRATLSRQGMPWLPDGTAYVTGFNVTGPDGTDYGAAPGLTLPLPGDRLTFDANAGFRYERGTSGARRWTLGDVTAHLDWRPNRDWQADVSATKVWQDFIRSSSVNAGLTFRW